jgi:hypothetical protein
VAKLTKKGGKNEDNIQGEQGIYSPDRVPENCYLKDGSL